MSFVYDNRWTYNCTIVGGNVEYPLPRNEISNRCATVCGLSMKVFQRVLSRSLYYTHMYSLTYWLCMMLTVSLTVTKLCLLGYIFTDNDTVIMLRIAKLLIMFSSSVFNGIGCSENNITVLFLRHILIMNARKLDNLKSWFIAPATA